MMTGPDMARVRDAATPTAQQVPRRDLRAARLGRLLALMLCAALGAGLAWLIISQ